MVVAPRWYACRKTYRSRPLLNTRVTLGISFWPSWTSGLAACAAAFCLTLYSASLERHALAAQHDRADRHALRLPRFRLGIVNGA